MFGPYRTKADIDDYCKNTTSKYRIISGITDRGKEYFYVQKLSKKYLFFKRWELVGFNQGYGITITQFDSFDDANKAISKSIKIWQRDMELQQKIKEFRPKIVDIDEFGNLINEGP